MRRALPESIALGWVDVGQEALGTRPQFETRDERRQAVVAETPFYDPKKQIAKGN